MYVLKFERRHHRANSNFGPIFAGENVGVSSVMNETWQVWKRGRGKERDKVDGMHEK